MIEEAIFRTLKE